MNDFSKAMTAVGIYLGAAVLSISIISAGLYLNQSNKSGISDNGRIPFSIGEKLKIKGCVVGMMYVPLLNENQTSELDMMFLIPPTPQLSEAAVSVYCMWERANGHFGRDFSKFFPVYANGEVDTSVTIGACYERKNVPNGSEILFSDERFKFYKDTNKQETEEKEIYIFMEKAGDNCPVPMTNKTVVYQLSKKGQKVKNALFLNHNRSSRYDIWELYNNIDSSDDINYDYYLPLS